MNVDEIEAQLKFYEAEVPIEDGYHADIVSKYDASRVDGNTIPTQLQIDSANEQLNQLKFRFIEVCTKELFLERISVAAVAEGDALPCPTMQELATSELAAEQEKAALKKLKNEREKSSRRLEEVCKKLASASAEMEESKSALHRRIRDVRAGSRLKNVTNILENGSKDSVRKLASDAELHDAKTCEMILSHLFSDLKERENVKSIAEAEVARLQSAIDRSVKTQSELNTRLSDYRAQIEQNERRNIDAPHLRELCKRNEKLYEMMTALTGARTSAIYDGGLCIEMTIDRPVDTKGDHEVDAQNFIPTLYKLDMTLEQGSGHLVTKVQLSPESNVSIGHIVSEDRPQPLLRVTQDVVFLLSQTPISRATDDSSFTSQPGSV